MPDNTHDPIRDLENFGTGGLIVNLLDPAEVRRLGDRHRARQRASMLVAASAVAVVVSIVPIALVVGKDDAAPTPPFTTTTPTPTPTESPTVPAYGLGNIPENFPLDVDANDYSGDGGEAHGPGPEVETSTPSLCNHDAIAAADARGRLGFSSTGPETFEGRELRTFKDEAAATAVMIALRKDLEECSTWAGDDALPDGRVPQFKLTQISADTGQESETFAVTEVAPPGGGDYFAPGGTVYQVTRVGAAILTLGDWGEFSTDTAVAAGPTLTKTTRKITPEMCLFTEVGCGPRTITFPGGGVMVHDAADAEKLIGTSDEFKTFIVAEAARDAAQFGDECPNSGIVVRKYRTDGFATGDVAGCSGYVAIWKKVDSAWKEVLAAQEAWNCADLDRERIPHSFAGEGCYTPKVFGPDSVAGISLGMTATEARAAGATIESIPSSVSATTDCSFLRIPATGSDDEIAGYYSPTGGVVDVGVNNDSGWRTPEGIGYLSSRAEVESTYPNGHERVGYGGWIVPLPGGRHYEFLTDSEGVKGMVLATDKTYCDLS